MKSGDILFLLLLWVIFSFTPYQKIATYLLFAVLVINSLSILSVYCPNTVKERYTEGDIKPGHLVSTFCYNVHDTFYILTRQLTMLFTGYTYFHTALAVEYQNSTYMLHAVPGDLLDDRKDCSYKEQIIRVLKHNSWSFYLEPLESFIEAERKRNSFLKIIDTGTPLRYNEAFATTPPERKSLLHCCYFLAKYLEKEGMMYNSSNLDDFLYYTPYQLHKFFPTAKEIHLT